MAAVIHGGKMTDFRHLLLFLTLFLCCLGVHSEDLEEREEKKVTNSHRIDSLNLLMFISLLILVVVTIWVFKHRRLRFVHETGLAIIYGLIVGVIIRYTSPAAELTWAWAGIQQDNSSYDAMSPPDVLRLKFANTSQFYFQYTYKENVTHNSLEEKQMEEKNIHLDQDTSAREMATFNPEVFFNVLLPPIIFHAGYSMKRRHFFRNFGAIVTYAFLGTAVSCFVVGSVLFGFTRLLPYLKMSFNDCLFFGALISATDPVTVLAIFCDLNVDVNLFAFVFGESVLNDAVAIVMSESIETYSGKKGGFDWMALLQSLGNFCGVFLGAFAIGSAMGCATALLTKYTHIRDYPLLETSLFVLMSYSTFLAAESANMTGIVAVLFCGICQAHYTYNNLSQESKVWTKQVFELLNFLMENFVFLYIGVSTFTFTHHSWDVGFIFASFLAVIIARACNIYPLSFLLNLGRSNKIRYNFQHMMMFSGLRGAIAFALAIRNTSSSQRQLMFSTTLLIVIATVIFLGGFTTQMLQWLKINVGVDEDRELQNFQAVRTPRRYQSMDVTASSAPYPSPSEANPPAASAQSRQGEKAWLVGIWHGVDTKLVKPFLTHAGPPLTETLPNCCLCLAKILTTEEQLVQAGDRSRTTREDSDTDLIIDDQELSYGEANNIGDSANATAASRNGATTQVDANGPSVDATGDVAKKASPYEAATRPSTLDV